ncbi:PKD domain-containing protein [Candidatus Peregrinibacteria bacterium]|nr:PKD domain-containing protein [Candidatus Peregrinibacteria bacterium]
MKYLRIIIFVLVVAAIVSVPLNMLLSTAQAANEPVQEELMQENIPVFDETDDGSSSLAPNVHTPDSYIAPQYDPFSNKFHPDEDFQELIEEEYTDVNTPPDADFTVRSERGLADQNSGTTGVVFYFSGSPSRDKESRSGSMRYRWDFESDGVWDTNFSRSKSAEHTFENAGTYAVTLQVLDGGGLLDEEIKDVIVVENTQPFAYFEFKPFTGTTKQVFTFRTSESNDSQYKDAFLEYRFDWNGDGNFDTPFDTKDVWHHVFEEVGVHRIVMEVRDPEGASSFAETTLEVFENRPPTASFVIDVTSQQVSNDVVRNKYHFDASGSTDPEGEKLQYRWDFNYTGENDINFSTGWTTSSQYSGFYDFTGSKIVRLQVRDADGALDETFLSLAAN